MYNLSYRSLGFRELARCPQKPGMGACRYSNNREVSGEVLGYVTGNIVEEEEGSLKLMYSSGERCSGGRARMVHVEFQCGQSAGAVSAVVFAYLLDICIVLYVCCMPPPLPPCPGVTLVGWKNSAGQKSFF